MQDGQFQIEDPKPKKKAKEVSSFGEQVTYAPAVKKAVPVSDWGEEVVVEPVKKKEVPSEGYTKFVGGIVQPPSGGVSPSTLQSQEGGKFVQTQSLLEVKIDPLQKVADIASTQTQRQTDFLSKSIPTVFPLQTDTPDKKAAVLSGNPDAIVNVVQTEQEQIKKAKDDVEAKYAGTKDIPSVYPKYKAELDAAQNIHTDITKMGIEALTQVFGDKLLASPDKSSLVQSKLGDELRKQKAKIGGDPTYLDQHTIADVTKKTNNIPSSISDVFGVVDDNKENKVIEQVGQELEFTNRATILNAAALQKKQQADNLDNSPSVQQFINATPDERQKLQNNPTVQSAIKAHQDLNGLITQSDNLINQYPEVKAQQEAQTVANTFADYITRARKGEFGAAEGINAERGLFTGTSLNDEYEIKRVSQLSGLPEDTVRKYAKDANIPSYLGLATRGFADVFKDTGQGLNRLILSKESADIQNKMIEDAKYHPSESLQLSSKNINADSILSTMFSTVGQIAAYGLEGYVGGEALGAASGLTRAANLARADLATVNVAEQILPANKLADLIVNLKMADTQGEALANIITAINKAKNIGGTFGSMYTTSFEQNYQEAAKYTTDEKKRKEFASSMAAATGLAFTILNPAGLLEKGLTNATSETIAKDFLQTGALPTAKDVFKERLIDIGKTVGIGSGQSLIPVVNENLANNQILDYHTSSSEFWQQALNSGMNMAVGILPLGVLGASKIPTSEYSKSLLFESGKQPELLKSNIEDSFTKGEITNDEKNRQISVVNTLQDLVKTVPDKNNEGKTLTQADKNNLVYLQLQHDGLVKKKENATESLKPSYDKDIKVQQDAINEIMAAKESTLTEDKIKTGEPSPIEKSLFEKVQSVLSTPKNETQDEINRAESVKTLTPQELLPQIAAQSIDAPTGVLNTLNGDRELTTDVIAQNPEADIEAARKKWAKTDSETADENVKLLEEGLVKKQAVKEVTPSENVIEDKASNISNVVTGKGKMEGVVTDHVEVGNEKVSLPEKGYLISGVSLNEGEKKGIGSGQEIYKKALDEHGILYSSFPISDDAMRVQNKLVEKGIAKIETIELSDGTELRKITKLSTPKGNTSNVGGDVKVGDKFTFGGNEWTVTEDNGDMVKATFGSEQIQSSFPKDRVAENLVQESGGGNPPIVPTDNVTTEDGGKEWTTIRKEKQIEIDDVKKSYEDQKVKHWEQSLDNGLKKLQENYPDKSIYDASILERDRIARAILNKEKPNIDDETLAVLQNLKRETSAKIGSLSKELNSPDDATRNAALVIGDGLRDDLIKTALVIKEGTSQAGRTLNYAQSELSFDAEHGLQIRRMELQKANGGKPLNDAQLESTAKRWEREKELMQKEQEIRETAMQETFDKKIADLSKDYEKKLAENKKSGTQKKEAKGKFEKQAKNIADKIMKAELPSWLKTDLPEGTQKQGASSEELKKLLADATINMGRLLDKGADFVEAVKEAVKDLVATLGEVKREDIEKGFAAHYKSLQELSENKSLAAIDAIKGEIEADKNITDITKGMVAKNQIRDFVESYFGTQKPKDILDKATEDLRKILPDVTKPKLVEAYLKTGDYELPTEEKLKSEIVDNRKVLTKLASIEKDLNDLKTKADVFRKDGNGRQADKTDDAVLEKQNELEKELNKIGQKVSGHDKYSQASFETRASIHNDRMQSIINDAQRRIDKGDLPPEEVAGLKSLQHQIEQSKIFMNDKSRLSPEPLIENGLAKLKETQKLFKGNEDIKSMLQKAIDQFEKDRKETEQDAKLQRTIQRLEGENKRKQGKLDRGETGFKQPEILTKSNAELIKLKIQRNIIDGEFIAERRKLEEKNKSLIRKLFDRAKSLFVTMLIYKPTTLAKVAWTGLIRPSSEAGSRLFGRTMKPLSPAIMERAKAGGESTSTRIMKDMFLGQFRSISEESMKKMVDKSQQEYESAAKKYTDAKESSVKGEELQKLKNNMDNALLDYHNNSPYQFIGSSSFKDVFDAFMHRSNRIEIEFGFLEKEQFQDKGLADKLQYLWEAVGRSHSALKTISARANFVAGFMARAEYAVAHDVPLTPEKLLEIANESYLDWERGKYQQSVFVTDEMNIATRAILRDVKGTKWERYGDYLTGLLKMDVAITRVPVNLLHEAVTEYTLGAFRALYKIGKTQLEARKEAKSSGITPDSPEFKAAIKDYISKMDANEAAKIVRLYRKGGVGLGLFGVLALGGIIHYGGFHHKNEKKKFRPDELQPGEVEVGDTRLNKFFSALASHTQFLIPAFLGANTAHAYNEKIRKKETTFNAAKDAVMSDLQYMQDQIPQSKLLPVIDITQNTVSSTMRQLGISKPKK